MPVIASAARMLQKASASEMPNVIQNIRLALRSTEGHRFNA